MSISSLLSSSLLLAALAVPSDALFAQVAPGNDDARNSSPDLVSFPDLKAGQNWFDRTPESGSNGNQLNVGADEFKPEQFKPPLKFQIQPSESGVATNQVVGGFCLKMRSYVVARDSKDSDSVHLVKYSTCQPASRYQVKTADIDIVQAPAR
jgi:hypothetical protein